MNLRLIRGGATVDAVVEMAEGRMYSPTLCVGMSKPKLTSVELIKQARKTLYSIEGGRSDPDFEMALSLADGLLAFAQATIDFPKDANRERVRRLAAFEAGMGVNSQTRNSRQRECIISAFNRWAFASLEDGSLGQVRTSAQCALHEVKSRLQFDEDLLGRLRQPQIMPLATKWIECIRSENKVAAGKAAKAFFALVGIVGTIRQTSRNRSSRG